MEKIEKILLDIKPDIDLNSQELVDGGILDSFDMVTLVSELIHEFNIDINVEDIIPENFNSVSKIQSYIERLK